MTEPAPQTLLEQQYARAYSELEVAMEMLNQRTNELVATKAQNAGLRRQITSQQEELTMLRAQIAQSQPEPEESPEEFSEAIEPGVLLLETE